MAPETLGAALELAALGFPVLPVRPQGKDPLTRRGVKDATTDEGRLAALWHRWPHANIGVATGAPGPTVLDIDDMDRGRPLLERVDREVGPGVPIVATPRGRHLYFRGTTRPTVTVNVGELRGRGSYVVAPPSIHPSGKQYVWLTAPDGPLRAPPRLFEGRARPAVPGAGIMPARDRIPPGAMYPALLDLAHRLAQARIFDVRLVEEILLLAFERWKLPDTRYGDPRAGRRDTRRLAEWAVTSDTARREQRRAALERANPLGKDTPE